MRHKSEELMKQIMDYAEQFQLLNHRSPYTSEIADALGIVKSTVYKYLVHTYTFVAVSGYLYYYNRKEKDKYKNTFLAIKNRIIKLMIPYMGISICWVIPMYILYYIINHL